MIDQSQLTIDWHGVIDSKIVSIDITYPGKAGAGFIVYGCCCSVSHTKIRVNLWAIGNLSEGGYAGVAIEFENMCWILDDFVDLVSICQ